MDDDTPVPDRHLTVLRWLVTTLTATMIAGLVILIWLFVTRFPDPGAAPLPDSIALPDGSRATAFTRGPDWIAVVTEDDRILILDPETSALRQTIAIDRAP
jgi:hypothetical protein